MAQHHKFKMSDGNDGFFRGQAPQGDAFQKNGMPQRKAHRDTEHERQAVGQHNRTKDIHSDASFIEKCQGYSMEATMERAITDKLNSTMKKGIEDGWRAREEEEEANKIMTQEQIDEAEDKKKPEDDDSLEAMRARRRAQMKEAHEKRLKYQALGHGEYSEIEEEVFLKTVTASERAVVHFYHKQFEKCKIMDMHLRKCAKKFMGTRFVRMDSEKAPFFVEKLGIKTLPCAVVFNDGVAKGRQVGFDGLTTGGDEFDTVMLAYKIKCWDGIEEDFDEDIEWN